MKLFSKHGPKNPPRAVADAGYAWAPGDASTPCDVASWSRGGGTSGCTACRAGLSTRAKGATSPSNCLAAPGLELVSGRVSPCRPAFFKDTLSNTACLPCPPGWTTALGATGSTERPACNRECARALWCQSLRSLPGPARARRTLGPACEAARHPRPPDERPCHTRRRANHRSLPRPHARPRLTDVVPGFAIARGATPGTPAAATPCANDTFSAAATRYDPAVGVTCQPCPSGARTRGRGASSAAACLAPPGFGWGIAPAQPRAAAALQQQQITAPVPPEEPQQPALQEAQVATPQEEAPPAAAEQPLPATPAAAEAAPPGTVPVALMSFDDTAPTALIMVRKGRGAAGAARFCGP